MWPIDTGTQGKSRSDRAKPAAPYRGKTGEVCSQSGCYRFDGYVDADCTHVPGLPEMEVPLSTGETFPPIGSTWKACWWALIESTKAGANARAFGATAEEDDERAHESLTTNDIRH
jgi:hypothetical protein